MKRTQIIDARQNIRRNRVSFLSIVIISMLAVTAYLGLDFSAEGIRLSANATYEAERYADIEISASIPFTQADLETVRATEGVEDAEGIIFMPSRVRTDVNINDIEVRTVPERISQPHLSEGRLPQAEDECAVEKALANDMGYRIGDRVQLAGRATLTDRTFRIKTFTVTGVFTSAEHFTEMVGFEPVMLVTRDAFNAGMIPQDRYTRLLVRTETENINRFSRERMETTDRLRDRLEELNSRWMAVTVHNTASHVSTETNADLLSTVSVTFSMLFVVIAALVIYSTIGRLVQNDSRLVGAQKALGLKNSEIFLKYLLFGTGGAVAGSVAGVLAAYFFFETIVLYFFSTVFMLSEKMMAFRILQTLMVTAGAAALSIAAVFLACRRLLKSTAVSLMSGQNETRLRKKKTARSGALYIRLMLRNMRTDLKRVAVSIVSIAGCCMLLMIGFSIKYAISRVPERQYGNIQPYNMEIALDTSAHPESMDAVQTVLGREAIPYAGIYMAETPYKAGESAGVLTLICPDDGGDLNGFFCFTDAWRGSPQGIPESGMLVSRTFAEHYDLDMGDSFLLYDSSMNTHTVQISGVAENYIGIYAVCSKAYAEKCFGTKLTANVLLLKESPRDPDALRQELSGTEGFVSLISAHKQQALFDGLSTMMNLVILLLGSLAVMIACFILLNLVSTYVNQKKNELTIMRINGYTTGETIRYASMECYGITVLGILLGLVCGQAFVQFLIPLIEQISVGFVKEPIWISFAASAAITAAISGIVHYFAFRKIRDLKLSDIQR